MSKREKIVRDFYENVFINKPPQKTLDIESCIEEINKEVLKIKTRSLCAFEFYSDERDLIIRKACDKHKVNMDNVLDILQAHKDYYL